MNDKKFPVQMSYFLVSRPKHFTYIYLNDNISFNALRKYSTSFFTLLNYVVLQCKSV